jgi:hypothetical protein
MAARCNGERAREDGRSFCWLSGASMDACFIVGYTFIHHIFVTVESAFHPNRDHPTIVWFMIFAYFAFSFATHLNYFSVCSSTYVSISRLLILNIYFFPRSAFGSCPGQLITTLREAGARYKKNHLPRRAAKISFSIFQYKNNACSICHLQV